MLNVMVVSKEVSQCCRLADALDGLEVNVFFVDSVSKTETYALKLSPLLVVLDGLLPESSLRTLTAALRTKHAVVILDATVARQPLEEANLGATTSSPSGIRVAVRRKLQEVIVPSVFGVVDYVQLACMSRRSVQLTCLSSRAAGFISIVEGEVWDAMVQDPDGVTQLHEEAAFRYWVTHEPVSLTVEPALDSPGDRRVFSHWEHLLLESMQLKDEGRMDSLRIGAPRPESNIVESDTPVFPVPTAMQEVRRTARTTAPPPSSQNYPERARALVNQAIRAIMVGDYLEAERAFEGALVLAPDDKLVEQRLHKVREFLRAAGQP